MFLAQQNLDNYFQCSQADNEGDETDHIVVTVTPYEEVDPTEKRYRPDTEPPAELTEDNVGFYIDLGPRNPRHGHKDAYQEIEDALKKAEEEDARAKGWETAATGLEDGVMMMDIDQEEHRIGGVGFGALKN